jgi:deoxyadenosine/deoxycytidine kinase
MWQQRIEVLGVFGSGKTTLAKKLAHGQFSPALEDHEKNPFWADTLVNQAVGYLPYDLSFLVQHANLALSIASATDTTLLCDWSFASDRLWASMRLGAEFSVYDAAYQSILRHLSPTVGYLYLRQPVDVIVERIRSRGRNTETSFLNAVPKAVAALEQLARELPRDRVFVVSDNTQTRELETFLQNNRCLVSG